MDSETSGGNQVVMEKGSTALLSIHKAFQSLDTKHQQKFSRAYLSYYFH